VSCNKDERITQWCGRSCSSSTRSVERQTNITSNHKRSNLKHHQSSETEHVSSVLKNSTKDAALRAAMISISRLKADEYFRRSCTIATYW